MLFSKCFQFPSTLAVSCCYYSLSKNFELSLVIAKDPVHYRDIGTEEIQNTNLFLRVCKFILHSKYWGGITITDLIQEI